MTIDASVCIWQIFHTLGAKTFTRGTKARPVLQEILHLISHFLFAEVCIEIYIQQFCFILVIRGLHAPKHFVSSVALSDCPHVFLIALHFAGTGHYFFKPRYWLEDRFGNSDY